MPASYYFPRQDVLEIEKTPAWYKQHIDFAEYIYRSGSSRISKMDRLFEGYNGVVRPKSVKYLTDTYGQTNKNKFIDYRWGRTTLDILHGEYLKIPIESSVTTTNVEAKEGKMQQQNFNRGAAYVREDLERMKEFGVDPLQGMIPEDPDDPDFENKINPRDKYEIIMQKIINAIVDKMDIHEKFATNFLHTEIVTREFGQNVVNEKSGDVYYEAIDPRDGIWMEFDGDPYMEKSIFMGRKERISINEVIGKFDLTDPQRQKLEEIRSNFDDYCGDKQYEGRYSKENGEYLVTVTHLEWYGLKRDYSKKSPKTKSQMEFSAPGDGFLDLDITAEGYERNKAKADKNAAANGQEIITNFIETVYEATCVGHDLYLNCREKPFVIKDEDTGRPMLSYTACVIKLIDGDAISMQETVENISSLLNVVMYQIVREIGKMKGKILAFNKDMTAPGKDTMGMLYDMLNESLIEYSAGNLVGPGGRTDVKVSEIIQEYDLGLSQSFGELVGLKNDLLMMLQMMTGVNNERIGDIQSSSTVTNAMQAIEASRTVTEALFYYNHGFNERVLTKMAETVKLVWGIYKPDKLKEILGSEDFAYLKDIEGLAENKYDVKLTNGRREQMLMEKITRYAEAYANSKELTFPNLVEVLMSQSLAEIKNVSVNGWKQVQKVREMELNKQLMAQNEASVRQTEAAVQMAREDREDTQAAEIDKIREKGRIDLILNNAKAKDQAVLDTLNSGMESNFAE